jgi:hypothetical protein
MRIAGEAIELCDDKRRFAYPAFGERACESRPRGAPE